MECFFYKGGRINYTDSGEGSGYCSSSWYLESWKYGMVLQKSLPQNSG